VIGEWWMKVLEAACPQAVFRLRCRDDGVRAHRLHDSGPARIFLNANVSVGVIVAPQKTGY